MDCISAVGEQLGLGIAVFVTNKRIPFRFFRSIIASCGFQIDLEFGTCLRCFNSCQAVVIVFENGDFAFDSLFFHIDTNLISLYCEVFRFCADRVNGRIKQITLTGTLFSNRPIIAAGIPVRYKLTTRVRVVGFDELIPFVDAIYGTFEKSISLCCSGFTIRFCNSRPPFFQCVCNRSVGHFVPFDCYVLFGRRYIPDAGVHLL